MSVNGGPLEYGFLSSSLGLALWATSPRGLVALLLGDSADSLLHDLKRRFAGHTLSEATLPWANEVLAHLDATTPELPPVPLDLAGTAFQRKVWNALRQIPSGQTTTYGSLARSMGLVASARAVGTACGANPVAVIVPCHRAVRSDGGLGGYRWGLERKRLLLGRESIVTSQSSAALA